MYLSCPDRTSPAPTGRYDRLYASRDLLWPSAAGRMVRRAVALRRPGRVLDAGCGDGKNAVFLSNEAWAVDGFDISPLAVAGCHRRFDIAHTETPRIWRDDCRTVVLDGEGYDMVVAYGLYHCLNEVGVTVTHRRLASALKPGGLFVCAAFNDHLPVPDGHGTEDLFLRPHDHLESLFEGWLNISLQKGIIEEDHMPLVGRHRHSLTWAIYEKPA